MRVRVRVRGCMRDKIIQIFGLHKFFNIFNIFFSHTKIDPYMQEF